MINFTVECYNLETNRWDVTDTAPTLDTAFDKAALRIGYSKIHDTVAILDMKGEFVYKSDDPIARVR